MTCLDTSAVLKRFFAEPGTLAVTVLMLTRDLVRRHPLKGFDAIHLASATRNC